MLTKLSKAESGREPITDERLGRIGDQHLAAVARGGDARGATDFPTDIVDATGDAGRPHLAGVDAHPDAHRRRVWPVGGGKSSLHFRRGGQRLARTGEDHKKGVALTTHLEAAMTGQRVPNDLGMTLEDGFPLVGAEGADPLARALDIREQHGDGSRRRCDAACYRPHPDPPPDEEGTAPPRPSSTAAEADVSRGTGVRSRA